MTSSYFSLKATVTMSCKTIRLRKINSYVVKIQGNKKQAARK